METINITLKIDKDQVMNFDNWMRQNVEVIDFTILPDTNELYKSDDHFKKLVKGVKDAQKLRNDYINEKNFK